MSGIKRYLKISPSNGKQAKKLREIIFYLKIERERVMKFLRRLTLRAYLLEVILVYFLLNDLIEGCFIR